jgi:hypothetical protein
MKNKIFGGLLAVTLLASAGAWAQDKAQAKKPELVEKTGVVAVQKADQAKHEKYDTITIKVGDESIKLLPGKDKKAFQPLEKMAGKTVTVKGEYLPANPPKYPLAAIKVTSVKEVKEAKAPAAAPAPEKK